MAAKFLGINEKEALKYVEDLEEKFHREIARHGNEVSKSLRDKDGKRKIASRKKHTHIQKVLKDRNITVNHKVLSKKEDSINKLFDQVAKDTMINGRKRPMIPNNRRHEFLILFLANRLTEFKIDNVADYIQGDIQIAIKNEEKHKKETSHIQLKGSGGKMTVVYPKKAISDSITSFFRDKMKKGVSQSGLHLTADEKARMTAALTESGDVWKTVSGDEKLFNVEKFLKELQKTTAADYFLFGFSYAKNISKSFGGGMSDKTHKGKELPYDQEAGIPYFNVSVATRNLTDFYDAHPQNFSLRTHKDKKGIKRPQLVFTGKSGTNILFSKYNHPNLAIHHPDPQTFYANRNHILNPNEIDAYNSHVQSNHFENIHLPIFGPYKRASRR